MAGGMMRALALSLALAMAATQNPLFGLPLPEDMQQLVRSMAEEQPPQLPQLLSSSAPQLLSSKSSPVSQLFSELDDLFDDEPKQAQAQPRVVVRALPARIRLMRLPSLSGVLRRVPSADTVSEQPRPRFAISQPLKMLQQLSSSMSGLPSSMGSMKTVSISSDGSRTVRTETTYNQDGTESTSRTVTKGSGAMGQGLDGVLSQMMGSEPCDESNNGPEDMPEELKELFGGEHKDVVQPKRRSAAITSAEAKEAVKEALTANSADHKDLAANIAGQLGLNTEDVQVSVGGQKKVTQAAAPEDEDEDEAETEAEAEVQGEAEQQDLADEDDKDEDEDEDADDKADKLDAAEELSQEVQEEKEEEADLKDREADTRAEVQAELAKSQKAVLEAKDDKERAEEQVAEAIKEVRVKKSAADRLQALKQQLEQSVVN